MCHFTVTILKRIWVIIVAVEALTAAENMNSSRMKSYINYKNDEFTLIFPNFYDGKKKIKIFELCPDKSLLL